MKIGFGLLPVVFLGMSLQGVAQSKAERKMAKQIKEDITYLASDQLEGRRTGTQGEKLAAEYIENRYKKLKIQPYKGQIRYPFQFIYGREMLASNKLALNSTNFKTEEDYFPLPFSGTGHVKGEVLPDVTEQGNVWMVPMFADADQAKDPHFEFEKAAYKAAKDAEKGGATGVILFDSYGTKFEPTFNTQSDMEPMNIPVAYLKHSAYKKLTAGGENKSGYQVDLNTAINKPQRTGTNLAAYIDNGAKYTVIIGAHYDHLGFGEDGNSLFANAKKEHQIHHGADDNASGTAALMEVAKWVKTKKLKNFNYLFLHFSGEELGLYGSKAFVKEQKLDSTKIAYMLNMDMVGRLNDSTNSLTLGGVGTSPQWSTVVEMGKEEFKLTIDSSGIGPSDHTSFYNAGVPVLFLFTGTHKDYHKPTDRADLINYPGEARVVSYAERILENFDEKGVKPKYTITKSNMTGGKSKFKVTLGIMPDYTYQEKGVKVDGVSDNKPAAKAGVQAGDIIIQLGDVKVQGMQTYMEALGSFAPGDVTKVIVLRNGKEVSMPLEFKK